jgi:hypothetical protein
MSEKKPNFESEVKDRIENIAYISQVYGDLKGSKKVIPSVKKITPEITGDSVSKLGKILSNIIKK